MAEPVASLVAARALATDEDVDAFEADLGELPEDLDRATTERLFEVFADDAADPSWLAAHAPPIAVRRAGALIVENDVPRTAERSEPDSLPMVHVEDCM